MASGKSAVGLLHRGGVEGGFVDSAAVDAGVCANIGEVNVVLLPSSIMCVANSYNSPHEQQLVEPRNNIIYKSVA